MRPSAQRRVAKRYSRNGFAACWLQEDSSIRMRATRSRGINAPTLYITHVQQVVVLNGSALPHSCTLGYSEEDYFSLPLLSIDGRNIRNLVDVASALERAQGPLVTFAFANDREIVLSLSEGQAATVELMRDFGIAAPWSPDVAAG